ncbi:hypothetical protein NLI96_g3134 [Meripilus lineatus]|uniref:C2H2-type domain-containing protein n=1 Tax=Meripilus lineatus TaxID=2056292 RepID=A0AAD5YL75_9APHY|nr:hypothetical protein NLI96_g3134 [Physisporinus lineatus]
MSVPSCENSPSNSVHSRQSSISSTSEIETLTSYKLLDVFDWEARVADYLLVCPPSSAPSTEDLSLLAKDWLSTKATSVGTSQLKTIGSPQSPALHPEQPSMDVEDRVNAQAERYEDSDSVTESDDWEVSSMSEDGGGDVDMDDWEVSSLSDSDDGNAGIDNPADDSSSEIDELADDDVDSSEFVRATLEDNCEESGGGEKMDTVGQSELIERDEQKIEIDELEDNDPGSSVPRPTISHIWNGNTDTKFVEVYQGKSRPGRYFSDTKSELDWDFASFDKRLPPGVTFLDVEQKLRDEIEKRSAPWVKKRGELLCLFDECGEHTASNWKDWKRMVDKHFPPRFQCPSCTSRFVRSDSTLRHHRRCAGLPPKVHKPNPKAPPQLDSCIQPIAYYLYPSILQKLGYELGFENHEWRPSR